MTLRGTIMAVTAGFGLLFATPAPVLAAPDANTDKAKSLYEKGRKAYRRGDMETALARFEEAYDLTENAIILYNIALTYVRLYETSNEVGHLRKAKVVLHNFKIELVHDPGLGDIVEVERLIQEIEVKMAAAKEESDASAAAPVSVEGSANAEGPDPQSGPDPAPAGVDTGRTLRLAGIGTLAGGGALAIGAVVGALVSQKNYVGETEARDRANADAEVAGCMDSGGSAQCDEFAALQSQLADRANAYRRNIFIFAGGLGGAAVVAIGAGSALFVIGNKRRNTVASSHLRIVPTRGGMVMSGRF